MYTYLGICGETQAAAGTSVMARMKPREKLMRAVQPSSTARYSIAASFSTRQPCSVPSPEINLTHTHTYVCTHFILILHFIH